MSMETALRARIKTGCGSLLATYKGGPAVFWSVRPQGSTLPAIVLTTVSDQRDQHFQGFANYRPTRVQIDCYGADRETVVSLREAALAATVPEETVGGVRFLRSFVNTVLDRGDQTETGFIHRDMIDSTIWHDA
jgi:hypothetical protein